IPSISSGMNQRFSSYRGVRFLLLSDSRHEVRYRVYQITLSNVQSRCKKILTTMTPFLPKTNCPLKNNNYPIDHRLVSRSNVSNYATLFRNDYHKTHYQFHKL